MLLYVSLGHKSDIRLERIMRKLFLEKRRVMVYKPWSIGALVGIGLFCTQTVWAFAKAPSKQDNQRLSQQSEQSCEVVLAKFNKTELKSPLEDVGQLIEIIRSLNKNNRLPRYFVTKQEASALGWQPGTPFNQISALKGKSIGGDRFGNYEKRLPKGQWQEADLDYKGGKRNAKRLVFSRDGERYVTVNHYDSFTKVPVCQ